MPPENQVTNASTRCRRAAKASLLGADNQPTRESGPALGFLDLPTSVIARVALVALDEAEFVDATEAPVDVGAGWGPHWPKRFVWFKLRLLGNHGVLGACWSVRHYVLRDSLVSVAVVGDPDWARTLCRGAPQEVLDGALFVFIDPLCLVPWLTHTHTHSENAARYNHLETVKVLVEHGARVEWTDYVSLRLAAYWGWDDIVAYLLEMGSDASARNHEALGSAVARGNTRTEAILRAAGSFLR